MLSRFLTDETGAVTADFVVLTAATVGLGIATLGVLSGGLSIASGTVSEGVSGTLIRSSFLETLATIDFTGGALGGWTGASVRDLGGVIGEALYIDQQQTGRLVFDVPPGSTEATMAFSLYGGDTLDNEDAIISVDGVPVVIATGYHGRMSIQIPQVDGTSVEADVVVEQVDMGTAGRYLNRGDSKALVSITVREPPDSLTLGVYSNNSHGKNGDEWWAVDDVVLQAR